MEYARNEPGLSVHWLMAKIVSIPPWASLSYTETKKIHLMVSYWLPTAIRVPAESQRRRKQKQQERAWQKHERPADGQIMMLALVLGGGW